MLERSGVQAVARALSVPAGQKSSAIVAAIDERVAARGEAAVEREAVHAAFALIDANGDGALSRIEVIKALRTHTAVRALLALPARIRQEDGTRDAFEAVFQQIDADDSKEISLAEFEAFFLAPPGGARTPARPAPARSCRPTARGLLAAWLGLFAVGLLAVGRELAAEPTLSWGLEGELQ
jgi:hypothetical protein